MQEALGGWWKMRWWRDKRKAVEGEEADEPGAGT